MNDSIRRTNGSPPQLLVSVRNASEAADALEGGANIIDVKEPRRGSLGASDRKQIEEVLERVAGRRVVSMAAGELLEARPAAWGIPDGIRYVKFGLSACGYKKNWRRLFEEMRSSLPFKAQIVPVAYADWRAARAPAPESVLDLVVAMECPLILVDTFDKRSGGLFDLWSFSSVKEFVDKSHSLGTAVAIAGGLRIEDLGRAADTAADVIGVRGAVCGDGRMSALQRQLVNRAWLSLQQSSTTHSVRKVLSSPRENCKVVGTLRVP